MKVYDIARGCMEMLEYTLPSGFVVRQKCARRAVVLGARVVNPKGQAHFQDIFLCDEHKGSFIITDPGSHSPLGYHTETGKMYD